MWRAASAPLTSLDETWPHVLGHDFNVSSLAQNLLDHAHSRVAVVVRRTRRYYAHHTRVAV